MKTITEINTISPKLKFAALYVISLVLIGIIITASLQPLSISSPVSVTRINSDNSDKSDNLREEEIIISTVNKLQEKLQDLYYWDVQYRTVNGGSSNRSIQRNITELERSLQKMLDSLEKEELTLKSKHSARFLSSLTFPYRKALHIQRILKDEKGPANLPSDMQRVSTKFENELRIRDDRIKELEKRLTDNDNTSRLSPTRNKDDLTAALKNEVNKNMRLSQENKDQKQTIDKLNKQLESLKSFIRQ